MPLATAYNESTLLAFMETELGATGEALGLLDTDGLQQAVLAVARLLGDDIADLTDMAVLEAAARWQAWLAAEAAAINGVDLKSSGDEIKLSQRLEGIRARLADARDAYYAASAASLAASTTPFVFGVACGGRGR